MKSYREKVVITRVEIASRIGEEGFRYAQVRFSLAFSIVMPLIMLEFQRYIESCHSEFDSTKISSSKHEMRLF
jgi:hypothetical protein